jgi:uncharacterized protein YbgA (DUF1722 family)
MQKVIQHLMGFLKNHLSSEDNACRWYVGAPGPHRGLPSGAGAAHRAADVASHRLKHYLNRHPVPEWVPVTFGLHQQVYLHPYPKELMLRNHV